MINFSTLQGLTIPEGVVTQITDASGRVLWMLKSGSKAVLEVKKITSDTYAGETTYTGEQFIAIDIYPKKNGTVNVTYGGLTKTIADTSGVENPNAQTVYFGTLYGVADSLATPESGELVIEGQFQEFGCGVYHQKGKYGQSNVYCACITAVSEWGDVTAIPSNAFYGCSNIVLTSLPSGITSIGNYAFYNCTNIALTSLPSSVTSIGDYAFYACTNLALTSLPSGLTKIGDHTFYQCSKITLTSLPSGITSIGDYAFYECTNLALTSLVNGLASIANYTFYGCTKLALTSLPSGITSIGNRAFYMCSGIALTSIPSGVTSIDDYAFHSCTNITSIVIPASVATLGIYSLYCNYNSNDFAVYTAFRFLGTTPPDIGDGSAGGDALGPTTYHIKGGITVPKGCATVYKAATGFNRNNRANYIVEAS
jgi:hypothetical protein